MGENRCLKCLCHNSYFLIVRLLVNVAPWSFCNFYIASEVGREKVCKCKELPAKIMEYPIFFRLWREEENAEGCCDLCAGIGNFRDQYLQGTGLR